MLERFRFLEPGELIDDDLTLRLSAKAPKDRQKGFSPAYIFDMRHTESGEQMGRIDLRIGVTTNLVMYGGQIGYGVEAAYRGNHYAARSCKLLFPLALRHDINPLWITCNPDNIASRKTCELAGGVMVEIVDLPEDNIMYKQGERQKCRYRFDL